MREAAATFGGFLIGLLFALMVIAAAKVLEKPERAGGEGEAVNWRDAYDRRD